MSKRIVSLLLATVILISTPEAAYAHSKDKHDQFMSRVLFGFKDYKRKLSNTSDEYKSLCALENAVSLCLDINNEEQLKELNELKIHGLPSKYEEIKLPGGSHHRRYTHRGWNYSGYSHEYEKQRTARKELLLQTVNKVFDFKKFSGNWTVLWFSGNFGYEKKCEAFAEFLYYIHIIADISSDNDNMDTGYSDMIKLAVANPEENSPDIYMELLRILPVIFESQSDKKSYVGLISDIKIQASEAREFIANTPDIRDSYKKYQEYAMVLLEKLESKVPNLLKEEDFFRNVFYVNTES